METFYEPTDQDLRDWQAHCLAMAADESEEQEEYLYHTPDRTGDDDDQNYDDFDDSMDGDHESALESVYGPNEMPDDYDGPWNDFQDNGEGFAC